MESHFAMAALMDDPGCTIMDGLDGNFWIQARDTLGIDFREEPHVSHESADASCDKEKNVNIRTWKMRSAMTK